MLNSSFDPIKDQLVGWMIYSDHAAFYSYKSFQELLQKYYAIQWIFLVGNSFDNRLIEF